MLISPLIATTVPAASAAAELVRQAHALKLAYQRTWRLEDLEAQIRCYLRAIDLLCEPSEHDEPTYAPITPPSMNSVAKEPFENKEDSHRLCAIGA